MPARPKTFALAFAASFSICATRSVAQRWQVDFAGNGVKYDTAPNDTLLASASIAPLIEWNRRNLYATLGGALAAFRAGEWTSQGHGDISLLFAPAPSVRPLRIELVGSADGSVHSGNSSSYRTAGTRGEVRLHFSGASSGVWIGGTATTGWTTGDAGIATAVGPTAGAWGRRGPWSATAVWTPFRLQGAWFEQAEGRLTTSYGPVDALAYLGWRGSGLDQPATTWGGASLTAWISRQAGLVVSGGTYASDLLQALPRGRYLSAGIRISRSRPSQWAGSSAGRALFAYPAGETDLQFTVAGASRVDLVGDWTAWQPVPLQRLPDGRWALRVRLTSGVHRFSLVVDGARWIVPDGVAAVDDGFGGKVALLVVP